LKKTHRAFRDPGDLFPAYEADAFTCGVDEAGRGPLAGPVCAAAVILAADRPIEGVADSKTLDADTRAELAIAIKARAVAWAVAFASVKEIDRYNILRASLIAMSRAVRALATAPRHALVDGNIIPKLGIPATAIVKGDSLVPAISAASILAKTARDALMIDLDSRYPHYGFAQHKGYATPEHLAALQAHGACPVHRRSFAPVKMLLEDGAIQLDMVDSAW
jgi:ribonuclease HII